MQFEELDEDELEEGDFEDEDDEEDDDASEDRDEDEESDEEVCMTLLRSRAWLIVLTGWWWETQARDRWMQAELGHFCGESFALSL